MDSTRTSVGDARHLRRVQLGQQVGLGPAAVLEVEQEPVQPRAPGRLDGDGRAQPEEGADQQVAGQDARAERGRVGHGRDLRTGRGVPGWAVASGLGEARPAYPSASTVIRRLASMGSRTMSS